MMHSFAAQTHTESIILQTSHECETAKTANFGPELAEKLMDCVVPWGDRSRPVFSSHSCTHLQRRRDSPTQKLLKTRSCKQVLRWEVEVLPGAIIWKGSLNLSKAKVLSCRSIYSTHNSHVAPYAQTQPLCLGRCRSHSASAAHTAEYTHLGFETSGTKKQFNTGPRHTSPSMVCPRSNPVIAEAPLLTPASNQTSSIFKDICASVNVSSQHATARVSGFLAPAQGVTRLKKGYD